MTAAEAETNKTALMLITPPDVRDAGGHAVPATLSVAGNTITLSVRPGEAAHFPVFAALTVVAPSDKVSAERDPFEYGLSDQQVKTFTSEDPKVYENISRLKSKSAPLYIQTARRFIPWNTLSSPAEATELKETEDWVTAVEKAGLTPYITIEALEGEAHPPSVGGYRRAVKPLVEKLEKRGVKRWGAWNEPDLSKNFVAYQLAAGYWQAARSITSELKCGCTVVAGEFYEYPDQEHSGYPSSYRKSLLEYNPEAWTSARKATKAAHNAWSKNKAPSTWGFHDYEDVVAIETTHASEFQYFVTGHGLGKPRVWISEAGVQLHNGVKGGAPTRLLVPNNEKEEFELQSKAANAFLALRYALPLHEKISRIERVYYYEYEAPKESTVAEPHNENASDSALVEAEPENEGKSYGEVRPAYCYLAYETHGCPPTIVQGSKSNPHGFAANKVNPHGLETDVFYEYGYLGMGYPDRATLDTLQPGVIHPEAIAVEGGLPCLPSQRRVVAERTGGRVVGEAEEEPLRCS